MPSEAVKDERGKRRLHPSSLLFSVGGAAKNLLLPGIFVLFVAGRGNMEIWLMILFVPAVIGAVLKYVSYRYRLGDEELVVRQGIVFRSERNIPYMRIQNVDLVRNPLHRMFGVAEVRLETASGQEPEAIMRVLSLDAVENIRTRVFAGRQANAVAAQQQAVEPKTVAAVDEQPRRLHSMSTRDVALFGLISNKGMLVVAAVMGLAWQTDIIDRWTDSLSRETLEKYRNLLPLDNPVVAVLFGIGVLLLMLVLMRVLSVAWAFLKFHDFRLSRLGDDLRAEQGLLTHVSKTVPRQRIQVLSTRDGFLHRWAGRTAVQVETAGGAEGEQSGMSDRLWLAPLIRKEEVAGLIEEALPEVDLDAVEWQSVSPRARGRRFRRSVYGIVVVAGAGMVGLGFWGILPALVLPPLAWLGASLYVKHTAYARVQGAVLYRSGWWVRTMSIARFSKIQSLHLVASPFDRRHRMASLQLDTAGATRIGHGIHISYLDTAVAVRLMNHLSEEAGRTAFRW